MNPVTLRYTVRVPRPQSHRFSVEFHIQGSIPATIDLRLPVWTPGSYLVREFAKHINCVNASSSDSTVTIQKINKDTWRLHTSNAKNLTVSYEVFAYELSVRSSHLDDSHGYFNGANLFLYYPEWKHIPVTLIVAPPDTWNVATGLERISQSEFIYEADNYDALIDSPVEIGHFDFYEFEILNIPHQMAVWGEGPFPADKIMADLTRLIQTTAKMFGDGLPYTRYLFIVHLTDNIGGGLEHRNSASIALPRFLPTTEKGYERAMALFSHEYFHLWNVKRLRPNNLGPFDYQTENYTSLLWALEGFTDYYAWINLVRSGIVPVQRMLKHWGDEMQSLFSQPARNYQTLEESSQDTWIKFYRPDANRPNNTISYYQKGALVGLFIDLSLRSATGGRNSLDDVFASLWQDFGDQGYPQDAIETTIQRIGGPHVYHTLQQYISDTTWFDENILHFVGLEISKTFDPLPPTVELNMTVTQKDHRLIVNHVYRDGQAEVAGVSPGDEIVALDGYRIDEKQFKDRLTLYHPGDSITLTTFHYDKLRSLTITTGSPTPNRWRMTAMSPTTDEQRRQFQQWLGVPFP